MDDFIGSLKVTHEYEQMLTAALNIARLVVAYRVELLDKGWAEDDAMQAALLFQQSMMPQQKAG